MLGTGDYVAPEQAQGHPLDGRADIYALGALLYHCLTGGPPYRGASFVEIAEQHLRAPVPSVQARRPEVSDGVAAIVARALAKRPDDRFADVGEMQGALEGELLALTRDDGSDTAEVPLVATALEVADPSGHRGCARSSPRSSPTSRADAHARRRGSRRVWPIGAAPGRAGRRRRLGRLPRQQHRQRGDDGARRDDRAVSGHDDGDDHGDDGGQAIARAVTASSYDPAGNGGDGSEHPADAGNALDGDPATPWRTDTYRGSADFTGIKPGVGLILTAPEAVAATTLHLTGGLGGWTGRVYTAPGATPPPSIDGWTPVSKPFVARSVPMDVPLSGGRAGST